MTPPTATTTRPRSARRTPATTSPRPVREGDLPALPDEPDLWSAAPLRDGRRDLRNWPDATRARLVAHYRPLALHQLRRHATTLAYDLAADEFESQADEWLLVALSRYDPANGPSFAAYLASMLGKWVHDVARARTGRYVNDAKVAVTRARDHYLAEHQHEPTTSELVDALGGDPAAAARRLRAVALLNGLRRSVELDNIDIDTVAVHADGGLWVRGQPDSFNQPDAELLARETQRTATVAITESAWHGDGLDGHHDNVRGLWMFALTELDGHSKHDITTAAGCSTRTLTTAITALLTGARQRLEGEPCT